MFGTILSLQPLWFYDRWSECRDQDLQNLLGLFVIVLGTFLPISGTDGSIVGIIHSYQPFMSGDALLSSGPKVTIGNSYNTVYYRHVCRSMQIKYRHRILSTWVFIKILLIATKRLSTDLLSILESGWKPFGFKLRIQESGKFMMQFDVSNTRR